MLASNVVFLPRFLGALPKALSPLGALARSASQPYSPVVPPGWGRDVREKKGVLNVLRT
jgi:hypothetical protein